MSNSPKVVIIGAGAAGIAAASRLIQNGITNITILEAENRIGGRINSVKFDGYMVDLGGQWCHGQKDNIVYTLAKDYLSSSTNNYRDFTFYLSDGQILDKSVTDRLFAMAYGVCQDEEQAKQFKGTFGHYFVHEFRKRVTEEFPDNQRVLEIADMLMEWFHKIWMGLEAANSWYDVSAIGPFYYQDCEGDLYLHWRGKGYKTILDILTNKIPDPDEELPVQEKVELNRKVTRILWNTDAGNVTVECSGDVEVFSYTCDHVIVTVSIGVLKQLLHRFVPHLPIDKQTAINFTAMGNSHKIFLKFPVKWWPDDLKGFSFVWTEQDKDRVLKEFHKGPKYRGRSWLEDLYGFYVINEHPRVLLGWIVGEMIEKVEELPDDVVLDGCMYILSKFVGKKFNIVAPNGMLRSKWKNNPNFCGAYSFRCIEAEKHNITSEDLATPVNNRANKPVLLFAGEATHPKFYSTVHGAIETGFREADRIINIYNNTHEND